jgi:probable HAF family extracellular repeat protein
VIFTSSNVQRSRKVASGLLVAGLAVAVGAGTSLRADESVLVDLGTLGGNASFALGISERGEVVGTARTSTTSRPQLAFAWRNGQMTNLGTLPGSTFSRAFAVNPRGVAVGEAFTAAPERSRAVAWDQGRIWDLGTLGTATGAVANDINPRGQIVGVSGGRAVLWERGSIEDLGTISTVPAASSRANAINPRGQIVGSSQTDILSPWGSRVTHAFLWDRGQMVDLGSPVPDRFSTAYGISPDGRAVGEANVGTPTGADAYHAIHWHDGMMLDLHDQLPGALVSYRHSRANAANSRGLVVGHVSGFYNFPTIDGRAVLWHGGQAYDLNDALSREAGWLLRSAKGINEEGAIVGYGTVNGQTRAFRLQPSAVAALIGEVTAEAGR